MEFIPCKTSPKLSASSGSPENDLPLADRVRALETQNKLLSDQISFLTSLVATLQLQLNNPSSGVRASSNNNNNNNNDATVPTKSPQQSDVLSFFFEDELAEEVDRLCASRHSQSYSSSPSRPREAQGEEEAPTPVSAFLTKKREEARDKGYTAIVNGITSAVQNAATTKTESCVGREVALLNVNNDLVVKKQQVGAPDPRRLTVKELMSGYQAKARDPNVLSGIPPSRAESVTSSEYYSDEDWHPEYGSPVAYFESYGSANGRPIYSGPRGGRFYFTSGGNKKYV